MDIDILSKNLFVSSYFLRLINPRNDRCGKCVICDKYNSKIKRHLRQGHMIRDEAIYVYGNIFGEESYFYMPIEIRKVGEFDDFGTVKQPPENIPEDRMMLNSNLPLYKENFTHKKLSRIELGKSNCLICGDCGKVIPKGKRYEHLRNHKKNEMVKCTICDKSMRQRYLGQHSKTCGVHITS